MPLRGDLLTPIPGADPAGADLRYDLEISFAESSRDFETSIQIPRQEACETCNGSGAAEGSSPTTCPQCHGRGQLRYQQGFFTVARTCGQCRGTGSIIAKPCVTCRGNGRVQKERKLTVPFILSSMVLFGLGVFFAFFTLPRGLQFLLAFQAQPQFVGAVRRLAVYLNCPQATGTPRRAASASMRFATGGCVENQLVIPPPLSGLIMNMCAVAGLVSMGTTCTPRSSFLRPLIKPSGEPVYFAAAASAEYSRVRVTDFMEYRDDDDGLFRLDVGRLDDRPPLFDFFLDERAKRVRGLPVVGWNLLPEVGQPSLH